MDPGEVRELFLAPAAFHAFPAKVQAEALADVHAPMTYAPSTMGLQTMSDIIVDLCRAASASRPVTDTRTLATTDLVVAGLSVAREKIIEQRLLSDLAVLMLRRGTAMDVLKSQFDAQGHDVVLEAAGVTRHVQLKATTDGGARRHVDINVKLRAKPSGCVAWLTYDPATLAITGYRWFGDEPGEPLPDLGNKVTRHTRGNQDGEKGERPALRNLAKSQFERLEGLDALADRLFGPPRSVATSLVFAQLRARFGTSWREAVAGQDRPGGFFEAIELAHLVDGYRVLEQLLVLDPTRWLDDLAGRWRAGEFSEDLGILCTQLFLEHRRWRFASPVQPSPGELAWLDELARSLHGGIARELFTAS